MIRNVVLHITNEQPLLADLFALPTASDAGLLCTNVRTIDGKRPIFIEHASSTFFFPYRVIRFLEVPAGSLGALAVADAPDEDTGAVAAYPGAEPDPDSRLPVPVAGGPDAGDEGELELDEAFLQRIRDV